MNWLKRMFSHPRMTADLSEEMQQHLDEKIEALVTQGMPREEAIHAARRAFGNATLLEQRSREVWMWPWIEKLWADLKFALRQLRKSPGFSATVIITIVLGMGANTMLFSLLYTLLLKNLPVPNPKQLVHFQQQVSGPIYQVLHDEGAQQNSPFTEVFGSLSEFLTSNGYELASNGILDKVSLLAVSGNAFHGFGLQPAFGRPLGPEDDEQGGGAGGWKAVLNYSYWKTHFNGDTSVLGRSMVLGGKPVTIIGIGPPGFDAFAPGEHPAIYVPLGFSDAIRKYPILGTNGAMIIDVFGRMRPNTNVRQAQAWVDSIRPGVVAELQARPGFDSKPAGHPQWLTHWLAKIMRLEPAATGFAWYRQQYRLPLFLLQGLGVLTLLLCCVSLMGLFSARALAERRALAVRSVLGASRVRLIWQSLLQALLLFTVGMALSFLLSGRFAVVLVRTMLAEIAIPLEFDFAPRGTVLAIALATGLVVAIVCSLAPLRRTFSVDLIQDLKEGQTTGAGRHARRTMGWWIPVQICVATVLTVAAALFGGTFVKLATLDPGFRADGVVTFRFDWKGTVPDGSSNNHKQADAMSQRLFDEFFAKIANKPGIIAASFQNYEPMMNSYSIAHVSPAAGRTAPIAMHSNYIAGNYFHVMGTHMVAGREFTAMDGRNGETACILNPAAAHAFFPMGPAIGSRLRYRDSMMEMTNQPASACTVVGIAAMHNFKNLRIQNENMIFFPFSQSTWKDFGSVLVRTNNANTARASVQQVLTAIAPRAEIVETNFLSDQISRLLSVEKVMAILAGMFSGLALLIMMVGIYGLLAYQVKLRTAEIGLRMALGSTKMRILTWLLRHTGLAVLWGTASGLSCAWILTRYVRSMLFGLHAHSYSVFAICWIMITLTATLAAYLPARRAASVDPMQALRAE
jgi:predicted permease